MPETSPNPEEFSRNDKPTEYTAEIEVRGRIFLSINAATPEDAQRQAESQLEKMDADGYVEIDEIREISLRHVSKDPPMYRVLRAGKPMQVSRLKSGDIPRVPDERGF